MQGFKSSRSNNRGRFIDSEPQNGERRTAARQAGMRIIFNQASKLRETGWLESQIAAGFACTKQQAQAYLAGSITPATEEDWRRFSGYARTFWQERLKEINSVSRHHITLDQKLKEINRALESEGIKTFLSHRSQ